MLNKVLIGADPEVFVGNNGNILTAIGKVGGTKTEPRAVPMGALQEDNVLLEFNIDPVSTPEDFIKHIRGVLDQGRQELVQHGLEVMLGISSHIYDDATLDSGGEQAWVFGCEPDYNGWTREANVMPRDVHPNLRTAGGHVHIGWGHLGRVTKAQSAKVIQMCDYILGLQSVLLDPDDRRKALYGKAGACRFKRYGVEYRTLSNFWLGSDELMTWAFNGGVAAYERLEDLPVFLRLLPAEGIQNIINTGDKFKAEAALVALGLNQ